MRAYLSHDALRSSGEGPRCRAETGSCATAMQVGCLRLESHYHVQDEEGGEAAISTWSCWQSGSRT